MNLWTLVQAHPAEIVLADGAMLLLVVDRVLLARRPEALRHFVASALAALSCLVGVLVAPGSFAAASILLLAAASALFGREWRFTSNVGEYYVLVLLATLGLLVMTSATSWLVAFLGLETASLALYALVAFDKSRPLSAEAGLKMFLLGAVSAAFLLYGLSLVYGLTGTLDIRASGAALLAQPLTPLALTAMLMIMVGFGFKIAAAPFHLWAPDAYQGAPVPAAALVASASKVGGTVMFLNVFATGLAGPGRSFPGNWLPVAAGWVPALLTVAAASMLLGNLTALVQRSVKRLLAYSSIAHAGYLLVGFAAAGAGRLPADQVVFYIATYAAATCGAFGVVAVVERECGSDDLDAFAGLVRRSPVLAALLAVFLLSLAGIPPLAGFFAKFQLFLEALRAGGTAWTASVALGLALSCVSLYYYLQVLKRVFVTDPAPDAPALRPAALSSYAVLALLALGLLAAGLQPDAVLAFTGR